MRKLYKWTVKNLKLRKKVICEFKYEALQKIAEEILAGRFKMELKREEVKK